ncbi:MAG TPA: acyl-CoA dehydrogenase family protein [Candidatus Polarisedimenticolaceae bacterium]|nr:acyl-CoA dehydrogenase family protein [Candidatus Polarisedimenticolaceae bacterium]
MFKLDSAIQDKLETIATGVAAAQAEAVDREGAFPKATMDALASAGLYGLISDREVGGLGQGPGAAAAAVSRMARTCGSTGMVLAMHYAGSAVIEKHGPQDVRRDIAKGKHLSTLAFSEAGSRSHFWAPVSTAKPNGKGVILDAEKSWVTSAGAATAYVWSSKPVAAEGASTIWLVPSGSAGLETPARFDGLGLRGNDSRPVSASHVAIPESHRLGDDGAGFGIMMGVVLPYFNLMNAAFSVGLMEAATERTAAHAAGARYAHMDASLADLPTIRAFIARMRVKTDMAKALVADAIDAAESGRDDAMLRVLECKAAAGETALEVAQLGMRVCGGAAYRKDVGVERVFRDAQAASVMAPTTDQLYDFIGKACCGLPLF